MSAEPIAISEDEPIVWFERTVSRRAAIRAGALELYVRPIHLSARKRYMREATKELDCPAWPHGHDADGEPPEDCRCGSVEDGWQYQCAADARGAIPVWRVEMRPRRIRRRVLRVTRLLYWRRAYDHRKSVLWGGKVVREAAKLDKRLGCGSFRLLGDRWLRPEPIEWIYCDVCGRRTPRYVDRPRRSCLADGHSLKEFVEPTHTTGGEG